MQTVGIKNIAAANSAAAIFLWAMLAIAIDVVRR
jgi:hypothetical protein